MKQLLLICAMVALVGCGKKEALEPSVTPKAKVKKPLTKEESAKVIEAAIRSDLNKPTGELTKADLEKVTMLVVLSKQLTDVKGLENLTQLTWVELTSNQLTDVKGLEKLTQLEELRASYNEIDNLAPLSHLPSLRRLGLGGNKITDLTPIGGLVNLEKLWLQENQIIDLTPLHGLKALETVFLNGNPDLSEDNIQQLHESLPECKIYSNPTK